MQEPTAHSRCLLNDQQMLMNYTVVHPLVYSYLSFSVSLILFSKEYYVNLLFLFNVLAMYIWENTIFSILFRKKKSFLNKPFFFFGVTHTRHLQSIYLFKLEKTREMKREKEEELRCAGRDLGLAEFKVTAEPGGPQVNTLSKASWSGPSWPSRHWTFLHVTEEPYWCSPLMLIRL